VHRDVSERKQSENALRQSEETFRRTFAAIPSPAYMWVEQDDGRVTLNQFNRAAEGITQGKIQSFLGIDVDRLYAGQPELAKKIKATMRDGKPLSEEIQYTFQSTGETKWLVVDYVRTSPGHVMVITRDVSERKEAEAKLLAYQEQLRALTSELTLVEERERRRLAADLHDQIGQNLALCKLKVVALERGKFTERAKSELSAVRRLLECSIQDARSLIFDLSPPVLYELGFEAALEWLAEWIGEQYHVPVDFESHAAGASLELDRQVILFQVVRELLVNMGKHAQAGRAKVILALEGTLLKIQVNDDGRGFDASRAFNPRKSQGGYGFFSMRERLNYLGGSIDVRSKPGMGSQITLTVPRESPAPINGGKEGS
jgi:signal transduction histidine kinase